MPDVSDEDRKAAEAKAERVNFQTVTAYHCGYQAGRLAGMEQAAVIAASDWESLKPHIHNGAIAWCGTKDRETDGDDIAYFKANWDAPGLLKFGRLSPLHT